MAVIGGYTIFSLKGQVSGPGETLRENMHPGTDGVSYTQTGRRADQFTLTGTIHSASPTAVGTSINNLRLLQGTVVGFTLDDGRAYTNHVCLNVQPQKATRVTGASDGTTLYTWQCAFTMRYPLGV